MLKKNNEILAILLASLSLFIFLSLIGFKSHYEPTIIQNLFASDLMYNEQLPFTGIVGASISSILVKYFLGYGSFCVCTILFMYAYLLFTRKDYSNKKYLFLSLYQLGAGLWLSIFLTWYFGVSNEAGFLGYLLHTFLNESIRNFIYILLPITFFILIRGFIEFSIYDIVSKGVGFVKSVISNIKSKKIEIHKATPTNTENVNDPIQTSDIESENIDVSEEINDNELDEIVDDQHISEEMHND